MGFASLVDDVLDRSILLGYSSVGLEIRKKLPGWPADPPCLDGKVVLVTGAGSGLGFAAAVGFARLGASVRVLGRDEERAQRTATRVREQVPEADLHPVACDISDRAGLWSFIDRFTEQEDRLDVLVNNAGVMPDDRRYTDDGVELTFATHVLAPWILIEGFQSLLERSAPARVINVSSGGQYGQGIPREDPESEQSTYKPKTVYARTKREQLVLTELWAERLESKGVFVHAMHPGWADTGGVRNWMPVFRAMTRPIIRDPQQGADTIVWLGAAPEAIGRNGLFWHDRRPRPTSYAFGAQADDQATRTQLWNYVARLAAGSS